MMKRIALISFSVICCMTLCLIIVCATGCTYASSYICGDGSNPVISTTKVVTTSPELQANIPVQGGSVLNPSQTMTIPK
jgi:hypothetical protein